MAKKEKNEPKAFLSDIPVGDRKFSIDPLVEETLDFRDYASALAHSVIDTEESLTIGIYGKRGAGKTSLMRLIQSVIDSDGGDYITVWFNAWQYDHERDLIIPLIVAMCRALDEFEKTLGKKGTKQISNGIAALSSTLQSILYGYCVKDNMEIPTIPEPENGLTSEEIVNNCMEFAKDYLLVRRLYLDATEEFRRITRDEKIRKPRMVIFIDDLDRCAPNQALNLLKGINLVLRQPGFSFLLALHPPIIQAFVKSRYTKDYGLDGIEAENFLEKIVQAPFYLPECKAMHMENFIRDMLERVRIFSDLPSQQQRKDIIRLIGESCENNPRAAIRLLNNILISLRIDEMKGQKTDPLSLFFSLILTSNQNKTLRRALEQEITVLSVDKESPVHFGEALAEVLEQNKRTVEPYVQVAKNLMELSEEQPLGVAQKALAIVAESRYLCNLFSTEAGLRWLRDPRFQVVSQKVITPVPVYREEEETPETKFAWPDKTKDTPSSFMGDVDIDTPSQGDEISKPPERTRRIKRRQELAPTNLLIHLTLLQDRNKKLRASLGQDAMVISRDQKVSKRLGKTVAEVLEKSMELKENFKTTSQYLLELADMQPDGLAQKGLRTLSENDYFLQVFSTEKGRKWLREPSMREIDWEQIPVTEETLLEIGFQHWNEILQKISWGEIEVTDLLIFLVLSQPQYKSLQIALQQGSTVVLEDKTSTQKLGDAIADVLELARNKREPHSRICERLEALADVQPQGLAKNALVLLAEKQEICEFFSLDPSLKWLGNPVNPFISQQPPPPEKIDGDQEQSELFRNEVRRQVLEEGVDPLSINAIIDDIRRNEAIPEFAKPYVRTITPLKNLAELISLSLRGCSLVQDLSPLEGLSLLSKLDLTGCSSIIDLSPVAHLKALEWLELTGCRGISNIDPLNSLHRLKRLCLSGCTGIMDLAPLKELTAMESLDLTDCRGVIDLRPIQAMSRLEWLDISGCSELTNVDPLRNLRAVTRLYLNNCPKLSDLEPLGGMATIKGLYLKNCSRLMNLAPLSYLKYLEIVDLTNCTNVRDLSPLVGLGSLQRIRILGTGVDINGIPRELRSKIVD